MNRMDISICRTLSVKNRIDESSSIKDKDDTILLILLKP